MDSKETFKPGEIVPDSGIYECNCPQPHHWSTDVKEHRFPPVPEGCSGSTWTLREPAHPAT